MAIVPRPLEYSEDVRGVGAAWFKQTLRVRTALFMVAIGLVGLLAIARYLDPYEPDGRPLRMGTHQQLGLPPCTFYVLTGLPCPSCGMTTSIAFFVRGDVCNSLAANAVGTLLAAFIAVVIPWCLVGAIRGRPPFVAPERLFGWAMVCLVGLLLARWILVLMTSRRWY